MRMLLVEDEARISAYVRKGLEEQGHVVDQAFDGKEALGWAGTIDFDVIVLDIMLPKLDGLAVCRELRRRAVRSLILMLTARDSVSDRVTGLDAGADDYLVKPFALSELVARIRALGRRLPGEAKPECLRLADLVLDPRTRTVERGGKRIELTAKEFTILEYMLREPERVFSRSLIEEHAWNYESYNESNIVDVYISNLRRKIDDGHDAKLIHTVRGAGYRLSAGGADERS